MNYLILLSLPTTFLLDQAMLETAYFTAQRKYHPDRFIGKSEEEKSQAAKISADLNEAYQTLKNPLKRAQHLLELNGINALDVADNATLMEMMELQEEIAEGKKPDIVSLIAECERKLAEAFEKNDLTKAKSLTARLSYLYKMQ